MSIIYARYVDLAACLFLPLLLRSDKTRETMPNLRVGYGTIENGLGHACATAPLYVKNDFLQFCRSGMIDVRRKDVWVILHVTCVLFVAACRSYVRACTKYL